MQIITQNIYTKRKLKIEADSEKILLKERNDKEIISSSTLVLSEIMRKKKRKKRRTIWIKTG